MNRPYVPPPPRTFIIQPPTKDMDNKDNMEQDRKDLVFKSISDGNYIQILAKLSETKSVPNIVNTDGDTILHAILKNKNLSNDSAYNLIKQLVTKGAPTGLRNKQGITPLQLASKNGNLKVVKLLIDKKENTEKQDKAGKTALLYAIQPDNVVCEKVFKKYKEPISVDVEKLMKIFEAYNEDSEIKKTYEEIFNLMEKYCFGKDNMKRKAELDKIKKSIETDRINEEECKKIMECDTEIIIEDEKKKSETPTEKCIIEMFEKKFKMKDYDHSNMDRVIAELKGHLESQHSNLIKMVNFFSYAYGYANLFVKVKKWSGSYEEVKSSLKQTLTNKKTFTNFILDNNEHKFNQTEEPIPDSYEVASMIYGFQGYFTRHSRFTIHSGGGKKNKYYDFANANKKYKASGGKEGDIGYAHILFEYDAIMKDRFYYIEHNQKIINYYLKHYDTSVKSDQNIMNSCYVIGTMVINFYLIYNEFKKIYEIMNKKYTEIAEKIKKEKKHWDEYVAVYDKIKKNEFTKKNEVDLGDIIYTQPNAKNCKFQKKSKDKSSTDKPVHTLDILYRFDQGKLSNVPEKLEQSVSKIFDNLKRLLKQNNKTIEYYNELKGRKYVKEVLSITERIKCELLEVETPLFNDNMDSILFMESNLKYTKEAKKNIDNSDKFKNSLFELCKSWAEKDYSVSKTAEKKLPPETTNKNKYDKYERVRILLNDIWFDDTKIIKDKCQIIPEDNFDFKLKDTIQKEDLKLKDFYTNENPEEYEKIGESFVSTWDFITAIEKNISYEITPQCDDKHNILNVSFKSDNFVLYYYRCKLIYDFKDKEKTNSQRNKIDEIFVSTMLNHISFKYEEKEREREEKSMSGDVRTKLQFEDTINDDSIIKTVNKALGYLAYDKKSNVNAKDIYQSVKVRRNIATDYDDFKKQFLKGNGLNEADLKTDENQAKLIVEMMAYKGRAYKEIYLVTEDFECIYKDSNWEYSQYLPEGFNELTVLCFLKNKSSNTNKNVNSEKDKLVNPTVRAPPNKLADDTDDGINTDADTFFSDESDSTRIIDSSIGSSDSSIDPLCEAELNKDPTKEERIKRVIEYARSLGFQKELYKWLNTSPAVPAVPLAQPAPGGAGAGAGSSVAASVDAVPVSAEEVKDDKEDKMDMWYYPYERAPLFQDVKSIFELIQYNTELVNKVFDYKQSVEDKDDADGKMIPGIYRQITRKIELAKNSTGLYLYERELNKILYYITNLETLKEILEKLYILKTADGEPENFELGDISGIIGGNEEKLKKIIEDLKKELNYTWTDDDKVDTSNVKVVTQIEKTNESLVRLGRNIGTLQTDLGSIMRLFSDGVAAANPAKQIIHTALFTDIKTIMTKIQEHSDELTGMLAVLELKRQGVLSASAPAPALASASASALAPASALSSAAKSFVPGSASPPPLKIST
uniref:Uncharacterized protein n=1 Tax=viral metagenome TaxID=1070528 RepID=A0A6C0DZY0_9ZZZZ